MQKFKQYYKLMHDQNKKLFADFKVIHDQFAKDKGTDKDAESRAKFNEMGRDFSDVVRDWERRLCSGMGRGKYSSYSDKLADKFKDEVRIEYPMFDLIGVVVKK